MEELTEEELKTEVINVPQQKTITGITAKSLDKKTNDWLETRARNKQNPPMIGKSGGKFPYYFVTYFWFDKVTVEVKSTAEGS